MNAINEKDFSKSFNIRETNYCNRLQYLKSDYAKMSYSQLILASENNILNQKKLIEKTDNIYTKYYLTKLLVKHAELLKRINNKIQELLEYLCKNTNNNTVEKLKHDLLMFHIFEFQSYQNALNILSEIKIFYKNLHKYDIEDQIGILNYKTNLAGIEYIKTKLDNNNMQNEANRVEEIINNYKISHDDNILYEIKEIEKKIKIEEFTNISNSSNNNTILFLIVLIFLSYYLANYY